MPNAVCLTGAKSNYCQMHRRLRQKTEKMRLFTQVDVANKTVVVGKMFALSAIAVSIDAFCVCAMSFPLETAKVMNFN